MGVYIMYTKTKLSKKVLNKILSDLEVIELELKDIVNRKIEEMRKYPPFKRTVKELVACDDQKIPTQTKLLQNFFNDGIMEIVNKYDLDIVEEFQNGHDYKMRRKPVEFKVTGSSDQATVANGNKNGGTKSPLLLSMKYKFDYESNEVTEISTCFLDENSFKHSKSGWVDSKGKDSWCKFRVANDDMESIHIINGSVTWKRGLIYGQFL
jgi:hypothetical protein